MGDLRISNKKCFRLHRILSSGIIFTGTEAQTCVTTVSPGQNLPVKCRPPPRRDFTANILQQLPVLHVRTNAADLQLQVEFSTDQVHCKVNRTRPFHRKIKYTYRIVYRTANDHKPETHASFPRRIFTVTGSLEQPSIISSRSK